MRTALHRQCIAGFVLLAAIGVAACDSPRAERLRVPDLAGWTRSPPPPQPPPPGEEPTVYESITVGPWCSDCVDAGTATVSIDGQAADLSALRDGSVVATHGARAVEASELSWWQFSDASKPFVDAVESWTLLQGPVDSVDVPTGRLVVMRQPVQVLRTAVDSPGPVAAAALAGVRVDDVVRVSGYRSEDGQILATRIDHVDPEDSVEYTTARIVGRLVLYDEYLDICSIGDLLINTCYDTSAPVWAYHAGKVVAVTGAYERGPQHALLRVRDLTSLGNGYRLLDPAPAPGVLVSVEGLSSAVTEYVYPPSAQVALLDFEFEGRGCEYDAGFTWKRNQLWRLVGVSMGDRTVGVVCYLGYSPFDERDGAATAGGVAGPIEAIDLEAQSLTVMGVTFQLNFVSRLGTSNYVAGYGDFSYTVRPLAEIELGSYADASGNAAAGDGRLLAHTILVESYEPETDSLRFFGTPSALGGTSISLLGQPIRVDGETVYIDRRVEPCIVTDARTFFREQRQATEVRVIDTPGGLLARRVAILGDSPPQASCPL